MLQLQGVHKSVELGLRVNPWLDSISSSPGFCHPLSTDSPWASNRHLPSIIHGRVWLDWWLASNLQLHIKNPKHSTTQNIKIHHSYCLTHLAIPKLPMANYYTHTTKNLQKWWSNSKNKMRGGEQEKVTVICTKKKGGLVFYFRDKFGKGTHIHMMSGF